MGCGGSKAPNGTIAAVENPLGQTDTVLAKQATAIVEQSTAASEQAARIADLEEQLRSLRLSSTPGGDRGSSGTKTGGGGGAGGGGAVGGSAGGGSSGGANHTDATGWLTTGQTSENGNKDVMFVCHRSSNENMVVYKGVAAEGIYQGCYPYWIM
jgi:hypothetical protein